MDGVELTVIEGVVEVLGVTLGVAETETDGVVEAPGV